ncbi:hypothetical protein G7Z17_g3962 [Cylindrodendrum hubeiense]|uniref:NACHT domain-containing protein n=1 Tax=Cylindrodendrum hubeiense TaxID=595255 RepID=A0A9P5HFS7_9HYPO|nr:hypothetical protein G7Z17_g3962 [Cylindrodendrum hubeiense]
MPSFTFHRIIAGIFIEPHATVRNAFLICCGLVIASVSVPAWSNWISTLFALRGPGPQAAPGSDKTPDGQAGHPREADEAPIVAVHGLAANPDYAWVWQPKNNPPDRPGYPAEHFNWLSKLLPAELSSSAKLSCRVMTFNYDSKWLINAPQQRLSNISDNLLRSLRSKREKATDRPLIFIGHSFGGNLIEQAIVSASLHGSGYTEIAGSTVGVVFLGTPHRGSAAAAWGALIASLAPPQFSTEKSILRDLEEHSSTLTDRLHDFSRWLFSESVVPEASACIDGHPKISLDADHFKINKFYGQDDPSFKLVYPEIKRMAQNAGDTLKRRHNPKALPMDQSTTSGDLRKCLQEMRVTNPRDILSDIQTQKGKRVGQTCQWILKREEFSAWAANTSSQFLCLIGSPGIGKTMMATFLIEVIQKKVEKSPDKAFAYFLFDDKSQERRAPTAMLRSLIWQLLLQRNGLFQYMQSDFDKHKENHLFENFSALWRIFQDMLQDEHVGEVFILIDALDECDKSTRKALLLGIRDLFSTTRKFTGNVKFLVTCRPEISDIKYELDGVGVSLRLDSSEVNIDLFEYIKLKVEDLARRNGYPGILEANVKEALETQAGGSFLWVSLMIKELESKLAYEVAGKLKDLPRGLDETYIRILENNIPKERREDARFLLLTMVAARRPLKKKEIASSFAFWKSGSMTQSNEHNGYMGIVSSCSSIISVDDASNDGEETVNFCHQSVKDFLLDSRHSGPSASWYHTSLDGSNLLMFEMCWRYLSSDELMNGSLVIDRRDDRLHYTYMEALETQVRQYSFLEYAFVEWEDHAIAIRPALLKDLKIDIVKAPTLRDAWLLRTVGEGHEAVVEILLATQGVDVNSKDSLWGQTPLSWAAENGHETIVKVLLTAENIDVDSKDDSGQTPLSWATRNGHETIVELLLATQKVDVNSGNIDSRTPLSWAARNGHNAITELLLGMEKIEIDLKDKSGQTPLSLATRNGHGAIVELLLATQKVDVNSKDTVNRTPLSWASRNGHSAIAELLLMMEKIDLDSKDDSDQTPLSLAARYGHEAIVKLLLVTEKIDMDSKDDSGQTPLSLATRYGHEGIFKLLFATQKVDVDSKDTMNRTPLLWAAQEGHATIVKLLLTTQKVEVDVRDIYGQTSLSLAAINGHGDVVELLLATQKVDFNAKDTVNRTPLSWAAREGNNDVVKLLLTIEKIEADLKDISGQTPLALAAENGHKAITELLLATEKINLDSKDNSGQTPLSLAARTGHEAVVEMLLATQKVKVDTEDNSGRTPLSWASKQKHEAVIKLLKEL